MIKFGSSGGKHPAQSSSHSGGHSLHSSPKGPRRSSSRSVKRKKFDDEVVESALKKNTPSSTLPNTRRTSESASQPETGGKLRKSSSKPLGKKQKTKETKTRHTLPANFGRWRPTDDLALITAVQQTNDLAAVHMAVKFSCNFTLKEIQERWYALLYNPVASRLAQQAIRNLPADVITSIQNSALWSKKEEALLADVKFRPCPQIETFEKLLSENTDVFHKSRTPRGVMNHWLLMRHYQLLNDQTGKLMSTSNLTLVEMENKVIDEDLLGPKDEILNQEICIADRNQKREINQLEKELPKWQQIIDQGSGTTSRPEFSPGTLAILKGRVVQYIMRSKEVTFGRNTSDSIVDMDFSLEGPAMRISRRQGVIRLDKAGFHVINNGKGTVFIDENPISKGSEGMLKHNSSFEVAGLKFLFLANPDLLADIDSTPKNSVTRPPFTPDL